MNKLQFAELSVGLKVKDQKGNVGVVKKIKDVCNIVVKFESGTGGYGFYCLDPTHKNYYDPLYKYEEPV